MMLLCILSIVIEIHKIKRLLVKMVLLKYSLLHSDSKLPHFPWKNGFRDPLCL